jgi:hypothetical protein
MASLRGQCSALTASNRSEPWRSPSCGVPGLLSRVSQVKGRTHGSLRCPLRAARAHRSGRNLPIADEAVARLTTCDPPEVCVAIEGILRVRTDSPA